MTDPTAKLVTVLRLTAVRLREGAYYRWTHMGACNCGHLAQTLTLLTPDEIRARAFEKPGEWAEQAREYCAASGLEIDDILGAMLALGLTRDDIGHLEKLSSPEVLRAFPIGERGLDHRDRDDVVRYLEAWADLLEAALPVAEVVTLAVAEPDAGADGAAGRLRAAS